MFLFYAFLILELVDQQLLLNNGIIENCKLNFYFSSNRLIYQRKIQHCNKCDCIFIYVVHRIVLLYNSCFAVCNFHFLHNLQKRDNINRILLCKPWEL